MKYFLIYEKTFITYYSGFILKNYITIFSPKYKPF